ncbi:ATP-binding protein [Adhaeribacter aquaticus]|uniref:ATP-binding protein n=1 Tax=Adhaeribacter aquaticus TaxID=299567 RepID=UPI000429E720|nr:ATP-binding protein [Adhaeribacter aquaticus]
MDTQAPVTIQELEQKLQEAQKQLAERNLQLDLLSKIGASISSELELDKIVQAVTDAATKISKAQFGAFFYNNINEHGEVYQLYTLSGVPREAFSKFPMPRKTEVFGHTFDGIGVVRSADITKDPRYGRNKPYAGMPAGHLPVRSYLAVPVFSKDGSVIGGLFFGHSDADVFNEYAEQLVVGIAAQAAVAIDNARLYKAVQNAEHRVRLVLESLPQITWTAKPSGEITYYNQSWYNYTGVERGNLDLANYKKVVHPDEVGTASKMWESSIRHKKVYRREGRLLRGVDKTYRWHLTQAKPVFNDNNELELWVGTSIDIDDYKKAQESLLQKNEELVKINEDLDNFVYRASHDLKSPVINILQLVEELKPLLKPESPDAKDISFYLDKSLHQLYVTIEDLSQVARAQRYVEEELVKINLEEVLGEVKLSLFDLIERNNAQVQAYFAELPELIYSRTNLKSILQNLISNAVKYRSPDRVPEVIVTGSDAGNYYMISVADNGIGFDVQKNQNKLFKMFSRLHDHTQGSGIGLYIVNRLVKNTGGYIEVESAVNNGSVFKIFLKKPALNVVV